MRYLSIGEVLVLYQRIMTETGGKIGIKNLNALESSLAQPRMTFDGKDLYPTIAGKAAVLGFLLIKNHPFSDGNKKLDMLQSKSFCYSMALKYKLQLMSRKQLFSRLQLVK